MKLFSIRTAIVIFVFLSTSNISCNKEVSLENISINGISGGTSAYTLTGSDGNCTQAVVKGTYTVNTLLQSSNNIQLQVNVTTIGTYAITTNIANGVQFSAAGNFTATGIQTILLSGKGIPVSAGTFSFSPPVGTGCNFLITFS